VFEGKAGKILHSNSKFQIALILY